MEDAPAPIQGLSFHQLEAMTSRKGIPMPYADALKTAGGGWNSFALILSDQCPWSFDIRIDGVHEEFVSGPGLSIPDRISKTVLGIRRSVEWQGRIPALELNETILNAIAHRSYCDPSPTIVDIRDHSIAVVSPGGMVRIDEGYQGRTRNPRLAGIIDRLGMKNTYVRGISGIISSYRGS